MQYIQPGPGTVHFGHFDATLAPVATVTSGETIRLRSVSGSPNDPVRAEWLPPELPAIYEQVRRKGPGPHILTGPIHVQGAAPGDVLQVDILAVRLDAPYGYNRQAPLVGIFPDAIDRAETYIIPIDQEAGRAEVLPGLHLPTSPFFGIMGVAPPPEWGRISSAPPRQHGGNLDNKELTAGTTLFLPVWAEGALFSAGDGHAAQGDGEVDITAIETCLEGEFRFQVRRDIHLSLPVAATPTHVVTMGFDEDLDQAARTAVRELLTFLEQHCGISWREAYRLASIAADLHVTQVVNGQKGIHAMLQRGILEQLGCRFPLPARLPRS